MWSAAKKRVGEAVDAVGTAVAGAADARDDAMGVQLGEVEETLQEQLKQLKSFVNGLNSMCGAALQVSRAYATSTGSPPFAETLLAAESTLGKEVVKSLATWLGTQVQRPIIRALEQTKAVRADINAKRKAGAELATAQKRGVGGEQMQSLRAREQECARHAEQGLGQVAEKTRALQGTLLGCMVLCQQVVAQEIAKLTLRGTEAADFGRVAPDPPPGWVKPGGNGAVGAGQQPERRQRHETGRRPEATQRQVMRPQQQQPRQPAPVLGPAPAPPPPPPQHASPSVPTVDIFDMGPPAPAPAPAAPPVAAPAGLDDFFSTMASPAPAPAPSTATFDAFAADPPSSRQAAPPVVDLFGMGGPPMMQQQQQQQQQQPAPQQQPSAAAPGGDDFFTTFGQPAPAVKDDVSDSVAVQEMREREARAAMQQEEKMMFVDEINADIVRWAGPDHNPKNIRALLQSFHTVWKHDTDKWQPLGFQDLLNGAQCRKAFRKAIRLVHPDKNAERGPATAMLAERIFEKLKEEFAKIKDEIGDTATAPVQMAASGEADASWGKDNASEVKLDPGSRAT